MRAGVPILVAPVGTTGLFARAENVGEAFGEILPWLLLLLGFVVLGVLLMVWIRRTFLATTPDSDRIEGFTLRSLRAMRERGEISEEEYERARNAMIARVRANAPESGKDSAEPSPKPSAKPSPEPTPNPSGKPSEPADERADEPAPQRSPEERPPSSGSPHSGRRRADGGDG